MFDIGKLSVNREPIPEAVRMARGWLEPLRLVQRLERRAAGLPALELVTTNRPGPAPTRRRWGQIPSRP